MLTTDFKCERCGKTFAAYECQGKRFCSLSCSARSRKYVPFVDESGARFGRLVVLRKAPGCGHNLGVHWFCICDCGKAKTAAGAALRAGKVRSCGCLRRDRASGLKGGANNKGWLAWAEASFKGRTGVAWWDRVTQIEIDAQLLLWDTQFQLPKPDVVDDRRISFYELSLAMGDWEL